MKRRSTKFKYAALIILLLTAVSLVTFSSFNKKIAPVNNESAAVSCTLNPTCEQAKANILATYNNSNGDKCAAVVATVNGIIKAHCTQCPTFDPCGLRQYAITNFPACHFTMANFISHCP